MLRSLSPDTSSKRGGETPSQNDLSTQYDIVRMSIPQSLRRVVPASDNDAGVMLCLGMRDEVDVPHSPALQAQDLSRVSDTRWGVLCTGPI